MVGCLSVAELALPCAFSARRKHARLWHSSLEGAAPPPFTLKPTFKFAFDASRLRDLHKRRSLLRYELDGLTAHSIRGIQSCVH